MAQLALREKIEVRTRPTSTSPEEELRGLFLILEATPMESALWNLRVQKHGTHKTPHRIIAVREGPSAIREGLVITLTPLTAGNCKVYRAT